MSFENNFNLVYTVLILPIAVAFQKIHSNNNKITKVETNQELYMKKVDKICDSLDTLTNEVHELIGEFRQHLRQKD